jgi:hypothetical protein
VQHVFENLAVERQLDDLRELPKPHVPSDEMEKKQKETYARTRMQRDFR